MFGKKKNKIRIEIVFDKVTNELNIQAKPADSKPTEIIQTLMLAIDGLSSVLKSSLEKEKKGEKERPDNSYVS